MRLYPKKLRNIEDLEREKKRLLKQAKELDKEDIFSFDKAGKGSKSKDKDDDGFSLVDMLPISNPFIKLALPFVQDMLFSKIASSGKKRKEQKAREEKKTKNNVVFSVAKEIIFGYLKWKAIELSYKGIKVVVKKSKGKKAARAMQPE